VAKPELPQNADTGVFSLGNFRRDPAQRGKHDLRGDRPFLLSYTLPCSRERFYVVKVRAGRVIFLVTILHFYVTILRIGAGRGNPRLGRVRMGDSPFGGVWVKSLPTPFGGRRDALSGRAWAWTLKKDTSHKICIKNHKYSIVKRKSKLIVVACGVIFILYTIFSGYFLQPIYSPALILINVGMNEHYHAQFPHIKSEGNQTINSLVDDTMPYGKDPKRLIIIADVIANNFTDIYWPSQQNENFFVTSKMTMETVNGLGAHRLMAFLEAILARTDILKIKKGGLDRFYQMT
jgi:hypothetical protein